MEKSNIKILISHHKESELIQSEIMMPIQVGAQNSVVDLGIQRDDEGINISGKNDKYCELTAQFWAWKNLDADYYGFMHYRRHFAFRDINYPYDDGAPVVYPYINQAYLEKLGLKDEAICRCVEGFDLILPLPTDMLSFGAVSNEVQYSCLEYQHAINFNVVCNVITSLYPDYNDAVEEFRTGRYGCFFNMFVMEKKIFEKYSEWLFRILEEAEKKIDFAVLNQQETRVLAFMAERLLNIFVIKLLKDQPSLKLKHLPVTFVHNTDVGAGENWKEIEPIRGRISELEYAHSVEKAYRELLALTLPYDVEDLFPVKDHPLETLLREKTLKFYGAGNWCEQLLAYFDRLGIQYPIEIWDRDAKEGQTVRGIRVVEPQFATITTEPDVLWIITVYNHSTSDAVKKIFSEHGIADVIDNRTFIKWLSYQLWLCVKNGTT